MTAPRPVRIDLLGPVELRVGGAPVRLGGPKQRAVLAALALAPGVTVSVARLVDVCWDDAPPASAVTKVHGHVSALRQALARAGAPPGCLRTRAPGYLLGDDLAAVDAEEFAALTVSAAGFPTVRAVELLTRASALWRGPALADVPAPAPEGARARLEEARVAAVEALADAELALGRARTALDRIDVYVDGHPYRETLRELRMRALIGLGRGAEAAAYFERTRRLFVYELGVEPGLRLRRLAASLRGAASPTPEELRKVGY